MRILNSLFSMEFESFAKILAGDFPLKVAFCQALFLLFCSFFVNPCLPLFVLQMKGANAVLNFPVQKELLKSWQGGKIAQNFQRLGKKEKSDCAWFGAIFHWLVR